MKKVLRKTPGNGEEKKKQKEALIEYRKKQAKLAIYRDDGLCVACYFWKNGYRRPYEHVHHVYGRGNYEKEHYTNLLCLCAACHSYLSSVRVRKKRMHQKQLTLLGLANEHPINPEFEHNFDEQN